MRNNREHRYRQIGKRGRWRRGIRTGTFRGRAPQVKREGVRALSVGTGKDKEKFFRDIWDTMRRQKTL